MRIVYLFVYFTSFQCILLSAVMLLRRGRERVPFVRLSALLVLIALTNFLNTPAPESVIGEPLTEIMMVPLLYLMGPALLFYSRSLFGRDYGLCLELIQYLPWAVFVIISVLSVTGIGGAAVRKLDFGFNVVKIAHVQVYAGVSLFFLVGNGRRLGNSYADLSRINLNWLYFLHAAFIVIFSLLIIGGSLILAGVVDEKFLPGQITASLLISLFIIITAVMSYTRPRIFFREDTEKYSGSKLTDDRGEKYYGELVRFMEERKPFLDENLTLKQLADETDIPFYHLSRIINEYARKNFCDFINGYRVDEVKRMLVEEQNNMTVLNIAFHCGFNSKSAFNAAFRRASGTTPLRYRKEMHSSIS